MAFKYWLTTTTNQARSFSSERARGMEGGKESINYNSQWGGGDKMSIFNKGFEKSQILLADVVVGTNY